MRVRVRVRVAGPTHTHNVVQILHYECKIYNVDCGSWVRVRVRVWVWVWVAWVHTRKVV